VADAFAELLDLIVRDYAITDAQKDVDLNAPAEEPASVIEADKRRVSAGTRFGSMIETRSKTASPMR
jgi:hypothetical protein